MKSTILILPAVFAVSLAARSLFQEAHKPRRTRVTLHALLLLLLTLLPAAAILGNMVSDGQTVCSVRRMRPVSCCDGRGYGRTSLNNSQNGAEACKTARVQTWEEVYAALAENSRTQSDRIALLWSGELNLRENRQQLSDIILSTGVKDYFWFFDKGVVLLYDLKYYDRFAVCETKEEAVSFLDACAEEGAEEFRIYFYPDLAETLFADECRDLNQMLSGSRIVMPSRFSYSEDQCWVQYTDVRYYDAAGDARDREDPLHIFVEAMEEHTDNLEESFTIRVSEELKELLMEDCGIGSDGKMLLAEIRTNCGAFSFQYYWSGNTLCMENLLYYAGKRILHAYQSEQLSSLDERERQTLDEALRIVSSVHGTELGKERMIHDALCDRITYYTDAESHDEKDCAVGALLNGLADCDGYSDAFYLCCNLAGIPVKYQHGNTYPQTEGEAPDETEGTHMWNLVKINGTWVSTDVTWDDRDNGISYMYYNIGSQRLQETHFWNQEAALIIPEENTLNSVRDPDIAWFSVSDWDSLYESLAAASELRRSRFCVLTSQEMDLKAESDRFSQLIWSTGVTDFSWELTKTGAELSGIEYDERFKICSTEAEAIAFVEECAREESRDFHLYFAPELAKRLFSDEHRALEILLVRTRLNNPFYYSYIEEYGKVEFEEAAYDQEAAKPIYVNSWDTVNDALVENSRKQAGKLALICQDPLNLTEYKDQLNIMIFSTGVSGFSWTFGKGVVLLSDLKYYNTFTVCSTEAEVLEFVEKCAREESREFRLYFTPELAKRLFSDDHRALEALLIKTRLNDPFYYSYLEEYGNVEFKNAEYDPEAAEYVYVRSWEAVYAALAENSRERTGKLALICLDSLDLGNNRDRLNTTVYSTGVKSYLWSFGKDVVLLYDMKYYDSFAVCAEEAEVKEYLEERASSRGSEIRVYCATQELYDYLHQDQSARFFALLEQAGCRNTTITCFIDYRLLTVGEARW